MRRREFLRRATSGIGATALGSSASRRDAFERRMRALPPLPKKFNAADTVTIGKTGIKTSRLAMGTGTVGFGHHSNQTARGFDWLSRLLLHGYDQGLRFFDSA